jgi:V/A-type H+/Na+-transporting ATPase subunit F
MKAYLISDNVDTQVGMRLAGINGVIVHEREKILKEIDKASHEKDIGIILITEKNAELVRGEINNLKLNMSIPLIIEVPDRHGALGERDRITRYINESIGVKI